MVKCSSEHGSAMSTLRRPRHPKFPRGCPCTNTLPDRYIRRAYPPEMEHKTSWAPMGTHPRPGISRPFAEPRSNNGDHVSAAPTSSTAFEENSPPSIVTSVLLVAPNTPPYWPL